MKRIILLFLSGVIVAATGKAEPEADTVRHVQIQAVEVYSYKTFDPVLLTPASLSQLTSTIRKITTGPEIPASFSGLTALAPNFYMPDYGSKLSSALYIRGVGSRMNDPAVGMYLDNVPLLDKGMYDFDFWDISRIDIVRGPQGSLYGRNSMGGVVSVYTPSPLYRAETKASLSYGTANSIDANVIHYQKLTGDVGFSAGVDFRRTDGFFPNIYDSPRRANVDARTSGSARLRLDWRISKRWTGEFSVAAERSHQNGYAYGKVDGNGNVAPVEYNGPSGYDRRWLLGSAHLRYMTEKVSVASTTSFQHFDDRMTLDQDFTTADLFTMRQKQNQNAVTQEVIVKTGQRRAYKWLFGAFGFYKWLETQAPVELKKDFFASIFPTLAPPMYVGPSGDCNSGGVYDTPSRGAAVFHQSDLTAGEFTFSAGLRLDYERISIDHNTSAMLPFEIRMPPAFQSQNYSVSANIAGGDRLEFLQFSPKVSVNWTPGGRVDRLYATVSRGYRAGGYNIQLFSDLISGEIRKGGEQAEDQRESIIRRTELDPDAISYKPEYSWNYEIGGRTNFFLGGQVWVDFALFHIDTRNQQVTQFVPSGLGRVMRNAARSASYGAEIWAHGYFGDTGVDVAWGYTHATFRDYGDSVRVDGAIRYVDYSGNCVPFSPRHTVTAGVQRTFPMRSGAWLGSITAGVRYTGAGKIFFTESNDASQDFYGLLSADVSLNRGPVSLTIWGKNLTNTSYKTFFFPGIMGNDFAQKGNPSQIGATLKFTL